MLIFSFRVRAGRLSCVGLFFPYIDVASHVFVVSVMCIFKKVNPARDPLYLSKRNCPNFSQMAELIEERSARIPHLCL